MDSWPITKNEITEFNFFEKMGKGIILTFGAQHFSFSSWCTYVLSDKSILSQYLIYIHKTIIIKGDYLSKEPSRVMAHSSALQFSWLPYTLFLYLKF